MKDGQIYQCSKCSAEHLKWQGQCKECGEWNSLLETKVPKSSGVNLANSIVAEARIFDDKISNYSGDRGLAKLSDLDAYQEAERYQTQDPEFNRVLGGGFVPGSVILLGGAPGIGKSTLSLSIAASISERKRVLYVTGEESLEQIALRAKRLKINVSKNELDFTLLAETKLESILNVLTSIKPEYLIVDSVQTLAADSSNGAAGSVSQLRECTGILVTIAKKLGICVLLIGHVTKQGQIAGPRILEHMVDTVLYFESDSASRYRFIRAVKNRFGAADELAVYAMLNDGLRPVTNPSAIFLQQRRETKSGSVYFVNRQGTRQLLLETQSLVDSVPSQNVRRVAIGLDTQRLNMLIAVMQRYADIELYGDDIYVNVVGGIDANETATDLAIIMAVWSAKVNFSWSADLCVFGEVGLSGEVRAVPYGNERIEEAVRQGFKACLLPKANLPSGNIKHTFADKIKLYGISHLSDIQSLQKQLCS